MCGQGRIGLVRRAHCVRPSGHADRSRGRPGHVARRWEMFHHEAIRLWRRKEALRNTYLKRPDLLRDRRLGPEDQKLLNDVMQESLLQVPVR